MSEPASTALSRSMFRPIRDGNAFEVTVERLARAIKLGVVLGRAAAARAGAGGPARREPDDVARGDQGAGRGRVRGVAAGAGRWHVRHVPGGPADARARGGGGPVDGGPAAPGARLPPGGGAGRGRAGRDPDPVRGRTGVPGGLPRRVHRRPGRCPAPGRRFAPAPGDRQRDGLRAAGDGGGGRPVPGRRAAAPPSRSCAATSPTPTPSTRPSSRRSWPATAPTPGRSWRSTATRRRRCSGASWLDPGSACHAGLPASGAVPGVL